MVLMTTPAKETQLHPPGRSMKRPEVCVGSYAVFSVSGDLFSLDTILLTQFVHEITEGEAREEIWSSVNYLFFISTSLIYRENQQVRQGIV